MEPQMAEDTDNMVCILPQFSFRSQSHINPGSSGCEAHRTQVAGFLNHIFVCTFMHLYVHVDVHVLAHTNSFA